MSCLYDTENPDYKLSECDICGAVADYDIGETDSWISIYCSDPECPNGALKAIHYASEAQAIASWNKRGNPDEPYEYTSKSDDK